MCINGDGTIDSIVLPSINISSSDIENEYDSSIFLLNGRKQVIKENRLEENLEHELQRYMKENVVLYNLIAGSNKIIIVNGIDVEISNELDLMCFNR